MMRKDVELNKRKYIIALSYIWFISDKPSKVKQATTKEENENVTNVFSDIIIVAKLF